MSSISRSPSFTKELNPPTEPPKLTPEDHKFIKALEKWASRDIETSFVYEIGRRDPSHQTACMETSHNPDLRPKFTVYPFADLETGNEIQRCFVKTHNITSFTKITERFPRDEAPQRCTTTYVVVSNDFSLQDTQIFF